MKELDVRTKYGTVHGYAEGDLQMWKGIPFAKPPVGERRFLPPEEPEGWDDVRDCTSYSPIPYQGDDVIQGPVTRPMSEDCLYLNIWKKESEAEKRPVFVWIYGGGFTTGEGSLWWYEGDQFALNSDVIFVTFNYRLGALGFLYLGEHLGENYRMSGNNGILDMVMALKWVKENIEAFGGDPDNITIAGQSAGSFATASLLSTKKANGLYNRAVLMSGSMGREVTTKAAAQNTDHFINALGLSCPEDILNCPAEEILDKQLNTKGLQFWPILDGLVFTEGSMFECLKNNPQPGMNLMYGWTLNEFNYMTEGQPERDFKELMKQLVPDRAEEFCNVYLEHPEEYDNSSAVQAFLTDMMFRTEEFEVAKVIRSWGGKTWCYRFDWAARAGRRFAAHALELPFVFGHLNHPNGIRFGGEMENGDWLSHQMMDAWTAFIRSGSPEHVFGLPKWPEYTEDNRKIMIFNNACLIAEDPQPETRKLWESVSQEERLKITNHYFAIR